ncbi:hypothetical protein MMC07_007592 [Pseudocyphellaria aurata]|nr:hypothetical protein [Pseudocyphellaria aurata]
MLSCTAITALIVASLKLIGSQTIDPSSVDQNTKEKWCENQKTQCPLLCLQFPNLTSDATEANDCDATSLNYDCICSNGLSPNASQYSLTIPYFECTEYANQCVKKCNDNDNTCQTACRTDHPCGAQSPTRVNITSSSSSTATPTGSSAASGSAASATDDSGVYTGFGGSTSTPSSGSGGSNGAQALAIGFGRTYGLAIVLGSVCGGFMILL